MCFQLFSPANVSAAEGNANWKPLFDGESLKGWKVVDYAGHGNTTVVDGDMRIEMGVALSGVVFTNELPDLNYEVKLKAKKVNGGDFFCGLTFPVKESYCTLVVGGWGGGVVGLSSLDGMDASQNETTQYRYFETGQWFDIRLRVRPESIQAWIDDELIVDADIRDRKINLRAGEIELSKPFGLSTYQTTSFFRDIMIRELLVE